jgi:protein phosphatase
MRQPVLAGDQFVLCSDGLWSEVDDAEIAEVVGALEPETACHDLIDRALARECLDNVSVQIVKVVSVAQAAPEPSGRRNGWLSSIFQRGQP